MPRVISGIARSIKLETLKGDLTRPTSDKVKESLFNILGMKVFNSRFLDLYAGSGQIGIEALSRNASSCDFVEMNSSCINVIEKNLIKTHLEEKAKIYKSKIIPFISNINDKNKYDLIYLDPPFINAVNDFEIIGNILCERNLLSENSILILEHPSSETPKEIVKNLKLKRSCKYGTIMLSFYEYIV